MLLALLPRHTAKQYIRTLYLSTRNAYTPAARCAYIASDEQPLVGPTAVHSCSCTARSPRGWSARTVEGLLGAHVRVNVRL